MRWWRFVLAVAAGGVFATILLGTLFLVVLFRTGPGHALAEGIIARVSGGRVSVAGLSGDLPGNVHADRVEISDARGVWLRVDDISLDWDALALLHNRIVAHRATAAKVSVLRKPETEKSEGKNPEVAVEALAILEIAIAEPVVGHAASLRARGSVHYFSDSRFDANLLVTQFNARDVYRVNGSYRDGAAAGTVSVAEDVNGILGRVLGLPNLGPIRLSARAAGNRTANAIAFRLTAGALSASGKGTISLDRRRADIDFAANAPAMQPRADIAWRSLALTGRVHGAFAGPEVSGALRVADVQIAGARIAEVSADVAGDRGALNLKGAASGLRIPGAHPDIFAAAPVAIEADASLGSASLPVTFALTHPLVTIRGKADTRNALHVTATASVPDVAPFAALVGQETAGSAVLAVDATRAEEKNTIAANAQLNLAGASLPARLLGVGATVSLDATTEGDDVTASTATVRARGLNAQIAGSWRAKRLDYRVTASLPDLSRVAGTLSGSASFSGTVGGPLETALVIGAGSATTASRGHAPQRIVYDIRATGLPDPASAQIRARGTLDGAPVAVSGDLTTQNAGRNAKFAASWKSLRANGNAVLPRAAPISGSAKFELARLADIASFLGTKLSGSAGGTVALVPRGRQTVASVQIRASGLTIPGVKLGAASVDGAVNDPFVKPDLALTLAAKKFRAAGVSGDADAQLSGPLDRLAVALKSDVADGTATAAAVVDTVKRRLVLQRLDGRWREQSFALKAPASVDFARGIAVDNLAALAGGGDVQFSGRITPALAASLRVQNVQAGALEPFLPVRAEGSLSGAAQLGGTLDAPRGSFALHGSGLRARDLTGDAVPPADLEAHGTLNGKTVALQATLTAGTLARLAVFGEAPLRPDQVMNLRVAGTADLAVIQSAFAPGSVQALAPSEFLPSVSAAGTLSITAQFAGTFNAPQGSIDIHGHDLRAVEYAGKVLPPARLDASGRLHGRAMTVNATLVAGAANHVSLTGELPLGETGPMALQLAGATNLAMLDPFLAAGGRRVRGTLTVDMTIAGTMASPRLRGGANLTNGELQDFARSVHLKDISASVAAIGGSLDIANFTARAGHGTIGASGSIDLDSPGIPLDIAIKAEDARPVESDLVTATFSGDLKLSGTLEEQTHLAGTVRISRGQINLPDSFPPEVAVLDVRRRGQAPLAPVSSRPGTLDLTVSVPGRIFVRGRGMYAELDGGVHVTGTSASPVIGGRFNLERGTLSVAGESLQFNTGTVGFDGTSVRNRLDPTLNFVAQTISGGVTATLTVGGYASTPKITLSSIPQLPQDEVLARLLFNQSVVQLSPLQLAEVAQGLAALGGIGTNFDPVGMVRRGLGLDRLTFGSISTGAPGSQPQTTLEAGKNIARNVYLGARQTFSGGTQLQVQYDITKNLKAQATASTINSAPVVNQGNIAQDTGSSVGLSYQFEY
ncbi:MAG TPA: translocation/assembly module TamB domain-containing protein [Rhizomicrobium sp.]|nr:translocation/assembly module TamB domain-containing protein [Rhizomicrobium sp.]